MSKGMLGEIPIASALAEAQKLLTDLAGDDGAKVLLELQKFNLREACWIASRHRNLIGPFEIPKDMPSDINEIIALGRYYGAYFRIKEGEIFAHAEPSNAKRLWLFKLEKNAYPLDLTLVLKGLVLKPCGNYDLLRFWTLQYKFPEKTGQVVALGTEERDATEKGIVHPSIKFDERGGYRKTILKKNKITGNAYLLACDL